MRNIIEVVIVGGGPAGLNAALVLGRCRRNVILFDDDKPRNAVSHGLHGFLSRDGIEPSELRAIAQHELLNYPSVSRDDARVVDAERNDAGFAVTTSDGRVIHCRKLLLAAGVIDHLPEQQGFRELYGRGVFHCPYCDGWEVRDKPLAVYGRGDDKGGGLALEMTHWSRDTVLCTDGPSDLSNEMKRRLELNGVTLREEPIERLLITRDEPYDALFDIIFQSGPPLTRSAVFFNTGRHQSTKLAERLGCDLYDPKGCKIDNNQQMSHVPGLYIAGDASRDVLQAVIAAAEGAQAAIGMNNSLIAEDLL